MRNYQGIKSRMAIEFTGWSGNSKAFMYAYRGNAPVQTHRHFSALDIRNIRLDLLGLSSDATRRQVLPPILNFRMAKGGTGKTTIAGNVAACMANFGHRVLMIDGDPQSSLSGMFGIDWTDEDYTHVGELMRRVNHKPALPTGIKDAVIPIYQDGMLDLIPADITMTGTDGWMAQMSFGREQAFTKLLEKELAFFSSYDAIIIDSAPSASLLTTAFMVASQKMIAVVMPEGQSRKALDILVSNVQDLNETFPGKDYGVHIVVNRYNQAKRPHHEEMVRIAERYGPMMNDIVVRDFVGFLRGTDNKSEDTAGPIIEREPNSVGTRDIIDLTKNLIKFYGVQLADEQGRPL